MASTPVIKTEVFDDIDIESKILELCQSNPKGITNALLDSAIPNSNNRLRVVALNRLISQGKIELLKQGSTLSYRLIDSNVVQKCKGSDTEDKLVYQIIEKSSCKGIWVRDIRIQSNLTSIQVNKALKNLESKKLIKSIKPVNASKKKVYMLYDLEPDCTVTGGSWYSGQEFEGEFVDVLNQICFKYLLKAKSTSKETNPVVLKNASYKSSTDIWRYISELKVSKVPLSVADIESILNTLIYDGKVEKTVVLMDSRTTENLYRIINPILAPSGLMKLPCGMCRLLDDCEEGGVISPSTCEYFRNWLDF